MRKGQAGKRQVGGESVGQGNSEPEESKLMLQPYQVVQFKVTSLSFMPLELH